MWQFTCISNKEGIDLISIVRGSRPKMFFGTGALQDFAVYVEKLMCWSLFLIKLKAWGPTTFSRRDSSESVFLWKLRNFWEQFFVERLWWLLLNYLYFKSCVFEFRYFAFHYLASDINIILFFYDINKNRSIFFFINSYNFL